ncbi:glycosyltransferase family 2 protein [Heliophilum fasciatum]|uniref:GT2 family glycosyltransferase n=1 Tax=Heliophilum fasciatum TaxID=35700 RepID=A0A4R2RM94_9FIRM|nr:glycosyltransferase family 2 protein [Heliophilum fasciatum]MCW2279001.1 glycosyltransferase involved in cell wall biosynthesis [Heliophilum fasciatum]TCP64048.1 GT2 family glycosyltransferase [Heliophilum fasciatum]
MTAGNEALVNILLSTYNGTKYLVPQLDSLIAQDYAAIHITARDDGSTDQSCKLLEDYSLKLKMQPMVGRKRSLQLIKGENIGAAQSFMQLIHDALPDAGYYAFCDQDDVWLPDKMSVAIRVIQERERQNADCPIMYCSRVTLADEDLHYLGESKIPQRGPAFANALLENIAYGCTVVFNQAAKKRIVDQRPTFFLWHDWWLYLVVSAFGQVIYDPVSRIFYRQHGANSVGSEANPWTNWRRRIRQFLHRMGRRGQKNEVIRQVEEFYQLHYADLIEKNAGEISFLLQSRCSLAQRLRYAYNGTAFRQDRFDDGLFRLLLFLNLI